MKNVKVILIIVFLVFALGTVGIVKAASTNNLWPPETNNLKQRLNTLGLPALSTEGTVLHIHEHLDIYLEGKQMTIPENIGINQIQGFLSPIHTHDTTGIIHVESPTIKNFTLGQFFTIWGVNFTDNCLGNYCNNKDEKLLLFSNGQSIKNNFSELPLPPHQEIVIVYGKKQDIPSSLPSKFNFPQGY